MVIIFLYNHTIEEKLLENDFDNQICFIPRIKLMVNDNNLLFIFSCIQFFL